MKKYLLAALLFPVPIFASAQVGAPSMYKYHDLPNGQRTIVPASSPVRSVGEQIWGQATSNTSGGMPQVGATGQLPNPSNGRVPAVATGTLPAVEVGRAAGRSIARIIQKVALPVVVGVEIYDLAKELGYILKREPDGAVTVSKDDPTVCTTAPCYTHLFNVGNSWGIRSPSADIACSSLVNAWNNTTPKPVGGQVITSWNVVWVKVNEPQCRQVFAGGWDNYSGSAAMLVQPAPAGSAVVTSTVQEFLDAVAAKSGWPSTSKVNDVIRNDPNPELQTPTGITVSGPASSPGPVSTTTTNNTDSSTNTTTNSTTTYNHTYAGDTITTTNTTVNITTNNVGAVTSTTTNSSTPAPAPAPPPPVKVCGLPDTPACKIDETGTKATAETTYDTTKTAIDTAKTSAETAITGAASIAAPAWSFSFQLPTGCAPYVTGIKGVILNVCQYQSTIHGLLSLIWSAATAFGLIGMVGRTIREA